MTPFGKAVMFAVCVFGCLAILCWAVFVEAKDVTFVWDPNTEPDVAIYTVYQADRMEDKTGPWQIIGTVNHPTVTYTTTVADVGNFAWYITATDESGNESLASNMVELYDRVPPSGPMNLRKQ
jgi:hypothetical protein